MVCAKLRGLGVFWVFSCRGLYRSHGHFGHSITSNVRQYRILSRQRDSCFVRPVGASFPPNKTLNPVGLGRRKTCHSRGISFSAQSSFSCHYLRHSYHTPIRTRRKDKIIRFSKYKFSRRRALYEPKPKSFGVLVAEDISIRPRIKAVCIWG